MAEREGFEPPIELPLCRISSAVLSTTQPPLHLKADPAIKQQAWPMPDMFGLDSCRRLFWQALIYKIFLKILDSSQPEPL